MSEKNSTQAKTEQPTQKRLRDLRKKGQVAKSRDIPSTAVMVAALIYFTVAGSTLMDGLNEFLGRAAGMDFRTIDDPGALSVWVNKILVDATLLVLPLMLILIAMGMLSAFIQVGASFSMDPVKPQLSRINPFEGFKRVFSVASVVELLKLLLKSVVLTVIVWMIIKQSLPLLFSFRWATFGNILPVSYHVLSRLLWSSMACFIAMAVFDLWFQNWNYLRQNRMTREDVKREHKEMEGDPHVKSRRRQLHREVNLANMLENVRKASVVVVNPTHIAVALYYAAGETDLPVVVAKGEGFLAQEIRRIAEEERIPILRSVDLARRLQEGAPLDQYIPEEFIEPVAAVLQWVRAHKTQAGS
jgi:type III secretion protein U